jgi:hypothetical protein
MLFTGPLAAAAIIPTSIVTSLVASTVMVKQLPIEGEGHEYNGIVTTSY